MVKQNHDTLLTVADIINCDMDDKAFCKDSKDGKDDTVASWLHTAHQELQW